MLYLYLTKPLLQSTTTFWAEQSTGEADRRQLNHEYYLHRLVGNIIYKLVYLWPRLIVHRPVWASANGCVWPIFQLIGHYWNFETFMPCSNIYFHPLYLMCWFLLGIFWATNMTSTINIFTGRFITVFLFLRLDFDLLVILWMTNYNDFQRKALLHKIFIFIGMKLCKTLVILTLG